jgi:hypothetical protein
MRLAAIFCPLGHPKTYVYVRNKRKGSHFFEKKAISENSLKKEKNSNQNKNKQLKN